MTPYWVSHDGRHVLYHGDCLEILPTLGKVDAVVTDPPYGVGFKYDGHYDDTTDGYREWCTVWFRMLVSVCDGPISISCGISNITDWPKPNWVLCWHKPASMGRCPVGFNNWEPLLLYGKGRAGQVVDVFNAPILISEDTYGHPCPKPVAWAVGAIMRISTDIDCILDPFTGSGTTGVACIRTGRKFIGIEISKDYCDIAVNRMEAELAQGNLFEADKPQSTQTLITGLESI